MEDGSLNIDFIENIMLFVLLGCMYNLTYNDSGLLKTSEHISESDMNTKSCSNNKINTVKKTLLICSFFSVFIE